jgi:hypothetical protein
MLEKPKCPYSKYVSLQATLLLVIITGICLSVIQYFLNRSLWLDEASLALNIINRSFFELAAPLRNHQMAPIGFLWAERLAVSVFGKNEYALRLFPLIGFLMCAPLLYLFSNKLTQNRVVALLATAIFSTRCLLIRYASEVKPYSTDVFFALLIFYLSVSLPLNRFKSLLVYGVVGSVAVLCSYPSTIILFVVGLYLLYFEVYQKKNFRLLIPFVCWAVTLGIYYCLIIHQDPTTDSMVHSWRGYFLPLNSQLYGFVKRAVFGVFGDLLGSGSCYKIIAIISLVAIGFICKDRKYTLLYYIGAPVVVHLILSSLKIYPFVIRLLLYLTPLVVLLYSLGLYYLFEYVSKRIIALPKLVLVVPILIMLCPLMTKYPIFIEEIKPALRYLEKHIKKDEIVYTYYAAVPAFEFYRDIEFVDIENPIVVGTRNRHKHHKYKQELLQLTGKVWFLFSHNIFLGSDDDEEAFMLDFLQSEGSELIDARTFRGSSLYYIDTKRPVDSSMNALESHEE